MPFERQITAATLHAVLSEPPRPPGSVITGRLIAEPMARPTARRCALLGSAPATGFDRTQPGTRAGDVAAPASNRFAAPPGAALTSSAAPWPTSTAGSD